jgi:hypothetical protein
LIFRFLRARREKARQLAQRVESARASAGQAQAEAEWSQQRLHSVRANVVEPRQQIRDRNHFTEIIRESLAGGYGGRQQ